MHHHALHIYGFGAFFLLGLAGSLHCVGMCGPLSALWIGNGGGSRLSLMAYHGSRLLSYLAVGSVFYSFGTFMNPLFHSWILFGLLIGVLALVLFGARLPVPGSLVRLQSRLLHRAKGSAGWVKASILGAFTPLLPCGLLYSAFAGVLMAPNWVSAMGWMAAFASGTIPLLAIAQGGTLMGLRRLRPRYQALSFRLLAGLNLAVLIAFWVFHHHAP